MPPLHRKQYRPGVVGPNAPRWTRDTLEATSLYRFTISADALSEFAARRDACFDSAPNWANAAISRTAGPHLIELTKRVASALFADFGVAIVDGIPLDWLQGDRARELFACLCLQLGELDYQRGPFYEVFDRGEATYSASTRYSDTSLSHGFHTDSTAVDILPDVVGLLCVRQSAKGGETRLVNMNEVHEILRHKHPALLAPLYREMIRDRAVSEADPASFDRLLRNRYPVFRYHRDARAVTFRYMRKWIELGHAKAMIPLSDAEVLALDALDSAMEDERLVFSTRLSEGSILFANNRMIAHDRTAYVDLPECKRLMLRACIRSEPWNRRGRTV